MAESKRDYGRPMEYIFVLWFVVLLLSFSFFFFLLLSSFSRLFSAIADWMSNWPNGCA